MCPTYVVCVLLLLRLSKEEKNKVEWCLPLTKDRSGDKEMMKDRCELRKKT
jgi:hypothetical protein